jgi:hypothetical protein
MNTATRKTGKQLSILVTCLPCALLIIIDAMIFSAGFCRDGSLPTYQFSATWIRLRETGTETERPRRDDPTDIVSPPEKG